MGVCTVWTIYFGISLENYIPNQQNDRFCAQSLEQQINKPFENHVLNESSNVGDIAELWTNPKTRCSAWNGWQIDLVFVAVSVHVACISLIIYDSLWPFSGDNSLETICVYRQFTIPNMEPRDYGTECLV